MKKAGRQKDIIWTEFEEFATLTIKEFVQNVKYVVRNCRAWCND